MTFPKLFISICFLTALIIGAMTIGMAVDQWRAERRMQHEQRQRWEASEAGKREIAGLHRLKWERKNIVQKVGRKR